MKTQTNYTGRCAPSLLGHGSIIVDDALTFRVRRFVARHGPREAQRILGVSDATFESARDRGRMKPETRDKIVAALDGFEAAAEVTS